LAATAPIAVACEGGDAAVGREVRGGEKVIGDAGVDSVRAIRTHPAGGMAVSEEIQTGLVRGEVLAAVIQTQRVGIVPSGTIGHGRPTILGDRNGETVTNPTTSGREAGRHQVAVHSLAEADVEIQRASIM
jgi:hypothetical protein